MERARAGGPWQRGMSERFRKEARGKAVDVTEGVSVGIRPGGDLISAVDRLCDLR